MAQVSHSRLRSSARRRSQRVLMQVGILIRGTDTHETPFEEQTETLAINAHGALILLENKVTSGATVLMRHKRTKKSRNVTSFFSARCVPAGRKSVWNSPFLGRCSGASLFPRKTGRPGIPTPEPSPAPAANTPGRPSRRSHLIASSDRMPSRSSPGDRTPATIAPSLVRLAG